MNYKEYYETIKDVEVSDKLVFNLAILWLHPEKLPVGLVSVGDGDLKIVKVPERVKNKYGRFVPLVAVARDAFAGNTTVTDIILPRSVTSLPEGAFAGCRNLRNIVIPKSIKKFRKKTFDGCVNLKNVFYEGTPEEWDEIEIVHRKHEIEFGDCIPGTPVHTILAERRVFIPGNEALLTADLHFHCDLGETVTSSFSIRACGKDITNLFYTM